MTFVLSDFLRQTTIMNLPVMIRDLFVVLLNVSNNVFDFDKKPLKQKGLAWFIGFNLR